MDPSNFGGFGRSPRDMVFDETDPGPFERNVKRLTAGRGMDVSGNKMAFTEARIPSAVADRPSPPTFFLPTGRLPGSTTRRSTAS